MLEFQELKLTYDHAASAIGRGQEPLEQLVALTRYLQEVCTNHKKLFKRTPAGKEPEDGALPAEQIRFVLEDLAPDLVKKMCRERSQQDQYLEVCGGVLEAFLNLLLAELRAGYFNQDFLLACRQIFDYDCMLHKYNFQIADEALQALFTKGSGQAWRNDLKEGDMVDAVLHYCAKAGASRGSGWTRARISKVEEDALQLEYPMELREADRRLDRWSVEIAQHETKTEEIWAWKSTIKVDDQLDALDDCGKWLKATVISIGEVDDKGRLLPMATVGMRIYSKTGARQDSSGCYDGWGDRFDEKIPVYSPRLAQFLTRSVRSGPEEEEVEESLDDVMKPEEGFSRTWAVPRPRRCTSSEYLRHVSAFCERGGLDEVLHVLENAEANEEAEGFNLCVLAILLSLVSLPAAVYHRQVMADYAPRLIEAGTKRLLSAPDRALRDVRREHIEAILRAVDSLGRRVLEKAERERTKEILGLEVTLLCLNSAFMERRIQGIRDLNQAIKSSRTSTTRLSGRALVEWMQTHGVFDVLFDPRKTHLQLIQRCDEVLKLLLSEDMLTEELLAQFWNLTHSDLKTEVFKIISDCSFYFKQNHLEFIFDRIKIDTPIEKLGMEEFTCLSELGKYAKDKEAGFQDKVAQFFWGLVVSPDTKNAELLGNCIQKYRDMVRYWDLTRKQDTMVRLKESIRDPNTPSLPCLKLLRGLIQDQSDRTTSTTSSAGQAQGSNAYSTGTAGGSALRARLPDSQPQGEPQATQAEESSEPVVTQELDLQTVLTGLLAGEGLVSDVLLDLARYSAALHKQVKSQGDQGTVDRHKLHVQSSLNSHHEEVAERLQFLKFIALVSSDFCITKKELGVIYDLLVTKSCIESDQQEFLTWCKSSCESQTAKAAILDLGEVGEFFTEKIACRELDVRSLPPVGFEFLQFYFISLNEKEGNLERVSTAPQNQQRTASYTGYQGPAGRWTTGQNGNQGSASALTAEESNAGLGAPPAVTLQKLPSELRELDMLWTLVLECQGEAVVPKVIDFLIKVHLSLSDELQSHRLSVLQAFVSRCMAILQEEKGKDNQRCVRVVEVLKGLVHATEVRGTAGVQPHGALLSGEALEPLRIRNRATLTGGELIVQVHSHNSLWDLRSQVAAAVELAPRHLQLFLGAGSAGTELRDADNGKSISALGLTGGQILTAQKRPVEEQVPSAALVDASGELTPAAERVFASWYQRFCDSTGAFTKEGAARFIQACCGDLPPPTDQRIAGLFQTYDGDGDGKIERSEFLSFYRTCSRGDKSSTVRENLRAFNVRPDLKKMCEVPDEGAPTAEDLPRYFMPRDQTQFGVLMQLLEVGDDCLAVAAWELIQMLATNATLYRRVLTLDIPRGKGSPAADWAKFFDRSSTYRLLYTIQIVQAVLEDGQGGPVPVTVLNVGDFPGGQNQVSPTQEEGQDDKAGEPQTEAAPLQMQQIKSSGSQFAESPVEDAELRAQWAEEFLSQGGFQHILKVFMQCSLPTEAADQVEARAHAAELKYVAFMLRLLRTFIMAAFSTRDADAYQGATLARRSSSVRSGRAGDAIETAEGNNSEEGASFKQLRTLLEGPAGVEIVELVDYSALQRQVIQVISTVLKKEPLMFEERLIVENALNLWVGCLLHRGELFQEFMAPSTPAINPEEFLLSGLLYCTYESVREQFQTTLSALCASRRVPPGAASPLASTLKLLSDNFQLISRYPSRQYFELFCQLLDTHFLASKTGAREGAATQVIDSEALLSAVIGRIREENLKAQQARAEGPTRGGDEGAAAEAAGLLTGLIQLAGKILDNCQDSLGSARGAGQSSAQQRGLMREIFTRYLYPTVFEAGGAKEGGELTMAQVIEQRAQKKTAAGGAENKSAAYKLLNSLVRGNPELMGFFFKECVQPLLAHIERTDAWNYTPPSASDRSQAYVGLRNLGCICYMNATLQQLFTIPALRYNLLAVDDGEAENLVECKGEKLDDNAFHQLQKLMANLELSDRSDYNPWEFCFAFKEPDGGPTNTGVQKDADEFLKLVFDRLEEALKGTPRELLLQSLFRGRTCAQLVCQECGHAKSRLEPPTTYMALPVKGRRGVYESLQEMVDGDVISDYECGGCKKRTDVRRRTLIAETPNVLIMQLVRFDLNYETWQTEKINSHYEFPQILDLAPYSYHAVTSKERAGNAGAAEGEEEAQLGATEEKAEVADGEASENEEPPEEDCYEYKLVGVTVHSGTAHAGHYWSLINTTRTPDAPGAGAGGEGAWGNLEADTWMEFNDSTVREFQASKLKEECFGGESGGSSGGFGLSSFDGWGLGGGYGKSAYMLFYERRKKKPLTLLEPALAKEVKKESEEESKEEEKEEEKPPRKESTVPYEDAVTPTERPGQLFHKVLEENRQFGFENDVYSQDFFDFALALQTDALAVPADHPDREMLVRQALGLGSKVSLELLSKAFSNACLGLHIAGLLELLRSEKSATLPREFLNTWYQEDGFDYLFQLLLECPDSLARTHAATLLKYVLVTLKMDEKEYLFEPEEYEIEGADGGKLTMQRPRSLYARFITKALDLLNTKVAKNWSRFDQFHELIRYVALADLSDVADLKPAAKVGDSTTSAQALSGTSEGARVGLEYFFKLRYLEKASDFMLGKKSPLCKADERRPDMGGSYSHPDFSSVIRLVTGMITDQELAAKYPMTAIEKEMLLHPDLLKTMLGSSTASKAFGRCLANMCHDDAKLTRKVSKVFLRAIEQAHLDTVKGYLKALKPFLRSDDSLKLQRLEWIFGVPEVVSRKAYGASRCKYGVELVDRINDDSTKFVSPILLGAAGDEALIAQIVKCRGRFDVQCISCLKELLSVMRKDKQIARFVYNLPSQNYQCARFTDWFRPYLVEQLADPARAAASTNAYYRSKYELLGKAIAHLDALAPTFEEFDQEQQAKLDKCLKQEGDLGFTDLSENWAGTTNAEVFKHFPPQLIVGKQVADEREVLVDDSHPLVRVEIFELDCEYAYSAPTGMFNVQLPHIEARASLYQSQSYEQYKRAQASEAAKNEAADGEAESQAEPTTAAEESAEQPAPKEENWGTRSWTDSKRETPMLLKVVLTNKTEDKDLKVWYRLRANDEVDPNSVNVSLARTARKIHLFAKNQKIVETVIKIDPTKPYFFKNMSDIKLEVEAVVRSDESPQTTGAGGKRVHHEGQTHDIGVGGDPLSNTNFNEDYRNDGAAYNAYQSSPQYDGYNANGAPQEQESLMGLLNLQPGQTGDADRRSDDSARAVAGYEAAAGSRRNSADLGDGNEDIPPRCSCGKETAPGGSWTCEACGQWLGEGQDGENIKKDTNDF